MDSLEAADLLCVAIRLYSNILSTCYRSEAPYLDCTNGAGNFERPHCALDSFPTSSSLSVAHQDATRLTVWEFLTCGAATQELQVQTLAVNSSPEQKMAVGGIYSAFHSPVDVIPARACALVLAVGHTPKTTEAIGNYRRMPNDKSLVSSKQEIRSSVFGNFSPYCSCYKVEGITHDEGQRDNKGEIEHTENDHGGSHNLFKSMERPLPQKNRKRNGYIDYVRVQETSSPRSYAFAHSPSPYIIPNLNKTDNILQLTSSNMVSSSNPANVDLESYCPLLQDMEDKTDGSQCYSSTPLHEAIISDNISRLRLLLIGGHGPNIKDCLDETPLHAAVDVAGPKGMIMCRMLLSYGADISSTDALGETTFLKAVREDKLDMVLFLQSRGADPCAVNDSGESALHVLCASSVPSLFMLDQLVRFHVAINGRNSEGETPLHIACRHGHLELIKHLLKLHADINAVDNAGRTPYQETNVLLDARIPCTIFLHGAKLNHLQETRLFHDFWIQVWMPWDGEQSFLPSPAHEDVLIMAMLTLANRPKEEWVMIPVQARKEAAKAYRVCVDALVAMVTGS